MNENAKLWVTALRSGEFKQGRNALRDGENGYCCLGVACEVYRRATGNGEWLPPIMEGPASIRTRYLFLAGEAPAGEWLPESVREWLGLADCGGGTCGDGGFDLPEHLRIGGRTDWSLATANDEGLSFELIAQLIEASEEILFEG